MTISTKALAKQNQLVNSLLNDLVKRVKGLREIITTLKKALNKVFNKAIKRVSSLYNVIKKKSLTESLLESNSASNELTQVDVSMISKIGKIIKSFLTAVFRPFAIGTKTLKALAAPKPIIVITIYALSWLYSAAVLKKILGAFSIGEGGNREDISRAYGSVIVRPALEMAMRVIASKQKNEIDRDLYLKALTLVKLGSMINTKLKLKNFSLFKVGTTNLALDVITNELQIKYKDRLSTWLLGGLLSAIGNAYNMNEILSKESMLVEIKRKEEREVNQETKDKIQDYYKKVEAFAKYKIVGRNMIFFKDLSEDEINIINKGIPDKLDIPKISLFNYDYESTTEYLKKIAKEKGITVSGGEQQRIIKNKIEEFITKKSWKWFLATLSKYVKSDRDKAELEKLKKEDEPIIF